MADDDNAAPMLENLRAMDLLTRDLSRSADGFGRAMSSAFARGIVDGRRFEDVLRSVGRSLSQGLLRNALAPVTSGLTGLLGGSLSGLAGLFRGGTGASVPVMPFAEGGVIASPAYFPLGRGLGLMGERGAEAILPLARGADGRLGVRAGGEARRPLAVTVQVSTPDVEGFRRSEAQVAAAVARAVARGSRAL